MVLFFLVWLVFLTENLEQKYQPSCISKYAHLEQKLTDLPLELITAKYKQQQLYLRSLVISIS